MASQIIFWLPSFDLENAWSRYYDKDVVYQRSDTNT